MAEFEIDRQYPYSPEVIWRALTEPELVARWTVTGRGGRPVGFSPVVGSHFQLVGRPMLGWRGVVDCDVLAYDAPRQFHYTWQGDEGGTVSVVNFDVEPHGQHTRLHFTHTGLSGVGGWFLAKILKAVRTKMFDVGLPQVLAAVAGDSERGSGSTTSS